MGKSELNPAKLLIVIINYFSATLVRELVGQLALQTLPDHVSISIICADNSAEAGQQQTLESLRVTSTISFQVVQNDCNLGFGTAINQCVNGQVFDFLCCINPDVNLLSNTLLELLNHSQQHYAEGIWGGITVDDRLKPDFRHAWQEPTLQNTLAWAFGLRRLTQNIEWQDGYQHLKESLSPPYAVDSVSGCLLLISAPAWQATNGFDPNFFLYSEEIDLCRRARSLGFQPTVVPQSKFRHAQHSSEESTDRIQTVYSSKLYYSAKHHGKLYNILYRTIIFLGALSRTVLSLFKGHLNSSRAWRNVALSSLSYKRIVLAPNSNK